MQYFVHLYIGDLPNNLEWCALLCIGEIDICIMYYVISTITPLAYPRERSPLRVLLLFNIW